MSEKNIIQIIDELKFVITEQKRNCDMYELYFKNGFKKEIGSSIKPELSFFCETKDFKNMDIIANLNFDNNDLRYIKSPDEAIKAFEWLKAANNNLKKLKYNGLLNSPGYTWPSYSYVIKTAFMEEFKTTISEFKNAYLNSPVNSKKGIF